MKLLTFQIQINIMKKFNLLLLAVTILASIDTTAQLNYLFSATSKPYVPVTGGIIPQLKTVYNYELSDEGFGTIPLGFTFNYNGTNHTEVSVSANGFITLGNPLNDNYLLFRNFLAKGPSFNWYARPIIAAFWDDLYLVDPTSLVYKTTGHAPFRVFTIEWKKARWSYDAPAPVLSIELKLYETTNIIEFHYKDEGGAPFAPFAYASIGITDAHYSRDFISLQNTSSQPDISMLKAMDSLTQKPANNQVYTFVPARLKAPANFRRSYSYTDKAVSYTLPSGAHKTYEYAITPSPVAPSSGTITTSPKVTVSSLSPASNYYLYVRSRISSVFKSQWVCDSFKTFTDPLLVPFMLRTDQVNPLTYFPEEARAQDFRDTSLYYTDGFFGWQGGTDFPNAGDNYVYYNKYQGYYDNDTWLFTRGVTLTGGKTYNLQFGYLAYYLSNPGEVASIAINYGEGAGVGGMTAGNLFKKENFDNFDLKDTTIVFTPGHSGVYYFGINDFSSIDGALPVIVNLSITEHTTSTFLPITLNGKINDENNILTWSMQDKENVGSFQLQRSSGGVNFQKIGETNSKNVNQHNISKISEELKLQPKTRVLNYSNGDEGNSKLLADVNAVVNKTGFMVKGIEKIIPGRNRIQNPGWNHAKTDLQTEKSYYDIHIKGINYYRLQYLDKNGKVSYSNIVALNNSAVSSSLTLYPNPAKDLLNIKIISKSGSNATLVVTDLRGRVLQTKAAQINNGETIIPLDVAHLPGGIYFLKILIKDEKGIEVKKFTKY